jgi:hypothetical protein
VNRLTFAGKQHHLLSLRRLQEEITGHRSVSESQNSFLSRRTDADAIRLAKRAVDRWFSQCRIGRETVMFLTGWATVARTMLNGGNCTNKANTGGGRAWWEGRILKNLDLASGNDTVLENTYLRRQTGEHTTLGARSRFPEGSRVHLRYQFQPTGTPTRRPPSTRARCDCDLTLRAARRPDARRLHALVDNPSGASAASIRAVSHDSSQVSRANSRH